MDQVTERAPKQHIDRTPHLKWLPPRPGEKAGDFICYGCMETFAMGTLMNAMGSITVGMAAAISKQFTKEHRQCLNAYKKKIKSEECKV